MTFPAASLNTAVSEWIAAGSVTTTVAAALLIGATAIALPPDLKTTLPLSAVPPTVAVNVSGAGTTVLAVEAVSVRVDPADIAFRSVEDSSWLD